MRVYKKDLLNKVNEINDILNTNIFGLSGAYGGYKLTTSTGRDVLLTGFTDKKDLYYNLTSYIRGLEYQKNLKTIYKKEYKLYK